MKFFNSIIKKLPAQKQFKATPEILSKALVLQVVTHLHGLYKLDEKENLGLKIDATMDLLIFQNTFTFYFSLFSLVVVSQINSDTEINIYGKLFLEEAHRGLTDSNIPKQYKRWALNDDSFLTAFDRDFKYYYQDQIQKKDLEDIQILMKILKSEKDNPIYYATLKLQYRIGRILKILPIRDFTKKNLLSFMDLWFYQNNMVTECSDKD